MKYLSPFLLTIFLCCSSSETIEPKNDYGKNSVDELESLLNGNKEVNAQLDIHWELYKKLRRTKKDQALSHLVELENLAQITRNDEFKGKAHHGYGLHFKSEGKFSTAIRHYLISNSFLEAAGKPGSIASNLNNIGLIFMSTGNFDYAIKYFQKAKKVQEKRHDKKRIVLLNINLGICHEKKISPELRLADEHYQAALQINSTLDSPDLQKHYFNSLYNQIGALFYKKGDYKQAVENYKKSLSYLDSQKVDELAIGYFNIGESFMRLGGEHLNIAEDWLNKVYSMDGFKDLSESRTLDFHITVSELKQLQGKHQEAIVILNKAIEIANKEIVNKPLQKALNLIDISHEHMTNKGFIIGDKRLYEIDKIEDRQKLLEDEFDEIMKNEALNESLIKEIELHYSQQQASLLNKNKKVAYWGSIILGISLIIGIGIIRNRNHKYKKAKSREKDAKAMNKVALEGLEGILKNSTDWTGYIRE